MADEDGGGNNGFLYVLFGVFFLAAAINYVHTGHGLFPTMPNLSATPRSQPVGSTVPTAEEGISGGVGALSNYHGRIRIANYAPNQNPNLEYLTLTIDAPASMQIGLSGFTVESDTTGKSRPIPYGVILPQGNGVNVEQPIFARGGDTIYLISGHSPTGYSFRKNACTGYFAQMQSFTPYLPSECPRPENYALPKRPNNLNDRCLNYIESLPSCFLPTSPLPYDLSLECQQFVADKYNYNFCIAANKDAPGFYGNEWRVYLNNNESLWKGSREIIRLLDAHGEEVSRVSY